MYALLDKTHADYDSIIATQAAAFNAKAGATNFVPVVNLAGTEALINIHASLPASPAVINDAFDPSTRDMTKWENPLTV